MSTLATKETRLKLQLIVNTDHSIHAGLVTVEVPARHFSLWNMLRTLSYLAPRTDHKCGLGPEV